MSDFSPRALLWYSGPVKVFLLSDRPGRNVRPLLVSLSQQLRRASWWMRVSLQDRQQRQLLRPLPPTPCPSELQIPLQAVQSTPAPVLLPGRPGLVRSSRGAACLD